MTGQQLQTLGAWVVVVAALLWVASFYLREAVRRLRARQAAALIQQQADWDAFCASVAEVVAAPESLYDGIAHLLAEDVDQPLYEALTGLADELENPKPPSPPEPTGDVLVLDVNVNPWVPVREGGQTAWSNDSYDDHSWLTLNREFGPLKVYEARS